jgi:hypothetical protein
MVAFVCVRQPTMVVSVAWANKEWSETGGDGDIYGNFDE